MESSDADESEGEKSASGMEMKKRASSKDLESPDDENSDGIALEEKEIMPLVQKKVEDQGLQVPSFRDYRYIFSLHQFS